MIDKATSWELEGASKDKHLQGRTVDKGAQMIGKHKKKPTIQTCVEWGKFVR